MRASSATIVRMYVQRGVIWMPSNFSTAPCHATLFATGEMALEPIRQLRRLFPRLITVGYVSVGTPERIRDVFDAGRAGIDGLILADRDDTPERLTALLEQAEARSVASKLKSLFAGVHPLVRDAVLIAVTRAHERLTPEVLARSLSLGRRALVRRLSDAGFPPPRRLITWGRLIVAAQLLEDPLRSADAVSLALDFPSGSAFQHLPALPPLHSLTAPAARGRGVRHRGPDAGRPARRGRRGSRLGANRVAGMSQPQEFIPGFGIITEAAQQR